MQTSDFELLLPVGQKEMAEAAIHNGADAIYVGFPGFNARGRSYDFELEELKQIIELCHLYGVRVNLAFNIVIFENELPLVVNALEQILPLKPDALIVQDLGLVKIIKEMCPEQTVHASTQMTVTNDLAIDFLEDLSIRRFVLGRENSLSEIKLIAERTKKELEVFVHGALCVSYSGQCFTSETIGGRSANRGQCAQSCRFSYELIVDGEKKNLLDKSYLVSPKDLCGISEVPELMRLGVKSFKVEGRLKSPEYVAQVAKSYRQVIDSTCAEKALSPREYEFEKNKMSVEYSRGFFPGWLNGVNHQDLVDGTFSSHRGLEIGKIVDCSDVTLTIELFNSEIELENGDGLLWYEKDQKKGGSIYGIKKSILNNKNNFNKNIISIKNKNEFTNTNEITNTSEITNTITVEFSNSTSIKPEALNSRVYLNHDKSQKKLIEKSIHDKNTFKKIPVSVKLFLALGKALLAEVSDGRHSVTLATNEVLSAAQKRPLNQELLFEEFASLASTVFSLELENFKMEVENSAELFLNHKEIKVLRQNIFTELTRIRKENKVESAQAVVVGIPKRDSMEIKEAAEKFPALNILLRNKEQVLDLANAIKSNRVKKEKISTVCLDFEFGRDYKDSVELVRSLNISVGVATTRILKPQEYINLKVIYNLNPDFILIRNLGALNYFQKVQKFAGLLKGDFSLNVTNHKTFNYLIGKGLDSICLSYDLNFEQTMGLLKNVNAQKAELTIHQSMPSFHMEHCVFAAFLSKGKSFKDCGKPCEKHKVQLKDQFGNFHWIKPDQECRNTMYNSSAQTALPFLNDWKKVFLGEIRFEALHESGEELIKKINSYIDVISGESSIEAALAELKTTEVYGLSARQLNKADEYQARKKDHRFL